MLFELLKKHNLFYLYSFFNVAKLVRNIRKKLQTFTFYMKTEIATCDSFFCAASQIFFYKHEEIPHKQL